MPLGASLFFLSLFVFMIDRRIFRNTPFDSASRTCEPAPIALRDERKKTGSATGYCNEETVQLFCFINILARAASFHPVF
jgi:hypothetical protein